MVRPGGTTTTTPTPTPTPTPTSGSVRPGATTTPVATPPTASGGDVKIMFKAPGRGTLRCNDGQQPSFDGSVTLEFDAYSLPVSCLVTMDGRRGAFQSSSSGTVTCSTTETEVVCN
jgi:hypothetical protein